MIKILLDDHHGVDINKPDTCNCTPLWCAACNGDLECVELLIANGGIKQQLDIILKSNGRAYYPNTTAKEAAQRDGNREVVALLKDFQANPIQTRYTLRLKLGIFVGMGFFIFSFSSIFNQIFLF